MAKPKGLGRGLDALLGDDDSQNAPKGGSVSQLLLTQLRPGKYQPRTRMDAESLGELAQSIRAQGLLQPILVRPLESTGEYEIIAGERRWRAAQMAGIKEVPVLIRDIPDEATLAVALIENIQREDLNPLEEAQGLDRLIGEFGLTHENAAKAVGRSRSAVSNILRLLQLSESVRSLLMDGVIEMGHARALLPLSEVQQRQLVMEIVDRGLSVRETERRVKLILQPAKPEAIVTPQRDILRLEENLADKLGAQVILKADKRGRGTMTIHYTSLDQLEGILLHMGVTPTSKQ
ncbi:MAG: ParB/RepB/Spo0J family partition protein [Ferrovum sp.]|jgi:ParB family chromosome partitioning protein|nr:ParB/RepB/Spo0J family partition protein [Ferrovum sp.]